MRLFRRLPFRPPLSPEERVVAWAGAPDDEVVVATNLGLWLPGAERRLGWHEIHKATWAGRQLSITPAGLQVAENGYQVMIDLPPVVVTLLDPDRVPEQVRARVTRSVAYTSHHPTPGVGGVRVVARRISGLDGLRWTVRYDAPDDATNVAVVRSTTELVAAAKAALATPQDPR